jgi:hypothetical protein
MRFFDRDIPIDTLTFVHHLRQSTYDPQAIPDTYSRFIKYWDIVMED